MVSFSSKIQPEIKRKTIRTTKQRSECMSTYNPKPYSATKHTPPILVHISIHDALYEIQKNAPSNISARHLGYINTTPATHTYTSRNSSRSGWQKKILRVGRRQVVCVCNIFYLVTTKYSSQKALKSIAYKNMCNATHCLLAKLLASFLCCNKSKKYCKLVYLY